MKLKLKILSTIIVSIVLLTVTPVASAHVVVKPAEVGVAQRTNFVVSVPTEEDNPTIQVRLLVPEGLKSVRPNVKPGWDIEIKRSGEGEKSRVAEIVWSGGNIPAEQRDEFVFSGQAPASETTLAWKAYQTYSDGKIVAWDNDPEVVKEYTEKNPPKEGEGEDHNAPRPYSQTKVINDLESTVSPDENSNKALVGKVTMLTWVSEVALVLAAGALFLTLRKK